MKFSFTFESVIRGHHEYKFVWTPFMVYGFLKMTLSQIHGHVVQMTKACAYNQGVLILEYFVQVENQCLNK